MMIQGCSLKKTSQLSEVVSESIVLFVDLNQSHVLHELSMCGQDHAVAIVQKVRALWSQ